MFPPLNVPGRCANAIFRQTQHIDPSYLPIQNPRPFHSAKRSIWLLRFRAITQTLVQLLTKYALAGMT